MSKFNLSESEKNRILGLHEPKKNKSVSNITEQSIIGEQFNIRRQVEPWMTRFGVPCFEALLLIFPQMEAGDEEIAKNAWNQSFKSNVTNGRWEYEDFYKEMCDVDGKNVCDMCKDDILSGDDCKDKCAHRPRDPGNNPVTAVMTTYFDGQKCRSLSWGGGAFWGSNGMEDCKKCCEGKTGDEVKRSTRKDIGIGANENCVTFKKYYESPTLPAVEYASCKYGNQLPIGNITIGDYITIEDCCALNAGNSDLEYVYKIPQKYRNCVSESSFTSPFMNITFPDDLMQRTYRNHYMYCTKEPYVGIPITSMSYMYHGERVGVSLDVCCGFQDLNAGEGEDDVIVGPPSDDTKGTDDAPRGRRKCNWKQEHKDVPTGKRRETYLKLCIKGDKVKLVQEKLKETIDCDLGKSGPNKDGVDGLFGNKTRRCVKKYQEKFNLRVDGIVGPETWNHMFPEDVKGKETPGPVTGDTKEIIKIIEKEIEKLSDKECRTILIDTSKDIKGFPGKYLEGKWPKTEEDETRLETIKYCFNMYTPGARIPLHTRRIKKTFRNNNIYDLRGKGNI